MDKQYKYHIDGSQPQDGEMFVFGSNLSGIHGAGAARAAYEKYGADLQIGFGPRGRSFAIPTKDWLIDSMSLHDIEVFVKQFVKFTYNTRQYNFFVTRVGCGLAGYKDSDIAPMFRNCNINCNFPEEWKQYIELTEA